MAKQDVDSIEELAKQKHVSSQFAGFAHSLIFRAFWRFDKRFEIAYYRLS